MKIAFIHPDYPGGSGTGAAFSATQIVEGLDKRGHDVSVFCKKKPKTDAISGLDLRHMVYEGKIPHTEIALDRTIRNYASELSTFDIIHSYEMQPLAALASIRRQSGTPVVVTLNAFGAICAKNDLLFNNDSKCTKRGNMRCLKCSIKSSLNSGHDTIIKQIMYRGGNIPLISQGLENRDDIDAFQALSPHVKQRYSEFGFQKSKIRVIPNILDENFLHQSAKKLNGAPTLLFVGYLHDHKGIDLLVPTFEKVVESYSRAKLTIIGDGPMRSQLKKQINDSNVGNQITFLGQIDNNKLPDMYRKNDIFINPGKWDEPFGRVFLEAMASGTPIVSTDIGSVKEIIGEGGKIATERNPSEIASKIKCVIQSYKSTSEKALNQSHQYKSKIIIPEFESLYSDII